MVKETVQGVEQVYWGKEGFISGIPSKCTFSNPRVSSVIYVNCME